MYPIKRRVFRETGEKNAAYESIFYENGDVRRSLWYARASGGYVRDGQGRQTFDMLASAGPALEWDPANGLTLAQLLRREWRRGQDAERRAERKRP